MTHILQRLEERCCTGGGDAAHCSLAELDGGCPARIVGFACDDEVTRRLFDLGFAPGQTAVLQRRAPLRDPLVFSVGGAEIALRRAEARRVLVTLA